MFGSAGPERLVLYASRTQGHESAAVRRPRLTYANVVATLALFLALSGGSALAASKLITGSQIAKGTITGANVKNGSLLSKDFKKGQLPKGATGATGAAGAAGAAGRRVVPSRTRRSLSTARATRLWLVRLASRRSRTRSQASTAWGLTISGHTTIVATPVATSVTVATYSPQQCSGDYEFGTSSGSDFTDGQGFNVVVP